MEARSIKEANQLIEKKKKTLVMQDQPCCFDTMKTRTLEAIEEYISYVCIYREKKNYKYS